MPDSTHTIRRRLQEVRATCALCEEALLEEPSAEVAETLRFQVEAARDRLQQIRDWLDNVGR